MDKKQYIEHIKKQIYIDIHNPLIDCVAIGLSYRLYLLFVDEIRLKLKNLKTDYTLMGKPIICFDSDYYEYNIITKRRCWERNQNTVVLDDFSEVK